jgi:chromosomal replication initiation ATPase DnaA
MGLDRGAAAADVETRLAILRKKARTLKIRLRDEIFEFLATDQNQRAPTGRRAHAGGSFASLSGKRADHESGRAFAQDILQEKRGARSRSIKSSAAWRSTSMCAWPT